jgi:hypothetical protein
MNKKIARISSKLYFDLYQKGGDKLIAVYAILKTSREQDKYYSYTAKNNKFVSGYSLLRSKTFLTLYAIKTYVPILIEMGLCSIEENGDIYVLGGEKIKELYNSRKLVPIIIGRNLNDTADNSLSVRVFSAKFQQERQINKKQRRSELLKQLSEPSNYKLYKKAKRLLKRLDVEEITIVDEVVLSNQGYAVLKNEVEDNKSMGCYWKQKLVKKGLIESKRRFKKLKKMSYGEYLSYVDLFPHNRAVYRNGFLCKEEIATLQPIDLTKQIIVEEPIIIKEELPKKQVKGLKHLEFDMIAWWQNN